VFRLSQPNRADKIQARDFIWVGDAVDIMLWLLASPGVNGLFNIGTGEARTAVDLAYIVCGAMEIARRVEFIDLPAALRDQYQFFTQARMDRLRDAGYPATFTSLEEGVRRYVRDYLAAGDRRH
jgi:ADP-L-glycero-D-manno-heptose 6-epimerase